MRAQSIIRFIIASAAVLFLALNTLAAAQAQTPTTQGLTATTSDGPTGIAGGMPVPGSIALLVARGENTPNELVNLLGAGGCNVESVGIIHEGAWRLYVNGAPARVNAGFPTDLPNLTPFFVRCL
jgi:hypothetical protein